MERPQNRHILVKWEYIDFEVILYFRELDTQNISAVRIGLAEHVQIGNLLTSISNWRQN